MKTTKEQRVRIRSVFPKSHLAPLHIDIHAALDDLDELTAQVAERDALLERVRKVVFAKRPYVEWHDQMADLEEELSSLSGKGESNE